jgi:GNAT superfamily N-acetyltransferase
VKITHAGTKEIDALCALLAELFTQEKEFTANYRLQSKALKRIINTPTIGRVFVVKQNNRIIAMASLLYTISTALGAKTAIIEDVIVTKKYQNQRIGSRLLKHIIRYAKQRQIKRITLLSDDDNLKAHTFYTQLGFKKSSMIVFRR